MKPQKLAILYPILFFIATSMLIRSWVPIFSNGTWWLSLLACLLSVVVTPRFFHTRWFVLIAIYSAIIFFNQLLGDQFFDRSTVANEIANLFMCSAFCYYCYESNDEKCIRVTFFAMLLLISIAAIGSFIVNQVNPTVVRKQDDIIALEGRDVVMAYYRVGLSNYLLPHGLPAIIAPLILLIKRAKKIKWLRVLSLVFLFLTLSLIYLGGSTAALLLSIMALSTFFINERRGQKRQKNVRFVLILAILFSPILIFPEFLKDIIGIFSSETAQTYGMHLQDMADYSSSGATGNTSTRMALYEKSLGEFFHNPLFGTNNDVSHHSVILDRLGVLGLVGIIPFIGIFVAFYNYLSNYLDYTEKMFFKVTMIVVMLMLLTKGIQDIEIWLMFIVVAPLLLYISHHLKYSK